MLAKTGSTKMRKRLFRQGQVGQSLILLAIGFIALTAFVGIVTDVSLLFVRYSTLRRAVDAAAVAAAGQMRRVPNADGSSVVNTVPAAGEDDGQSISVANLNLAARQFIEVYGLNPSQVLAETCYAQQIRRDPATDRPQDRNGVNLYTYNAGGSKTGDNPAANAADRDRYEELCKENELKLVRVTAQIESPTVFLRLLGIPSLTLTESSISQTAVLDVVLILDVSESMAYQTTYDDWEEEGYGYRYVPPKVYTQDVDTWNADLRDHSMTDILTQLNTDPNSTAALKYGEVSIATSPPAAFIDSTGVWRTGPTVSFLPDGAPNTPTRQECQVRLAPISDYDVGSDIPAWLREEYVDALGESWVAQRFDTFEPGNFRSFYPMYNSYACCNDPDGDGDFEDLVCEPFKGVRDATSEFLEHLDFIRGDRVAFVTFDHTAHIIDPDGTGGQSPMIETQNDLNINGDVDADGYPIIDPNLNERYGAQRVLNSVAGVRAELTYYADNDDGDLYWDGLKDYDTGSGDWIGHDWNYFQNTAMSSIYLQPSISSCWLDRAVLLPPQVPGTTQVRLNGNVSWSLLPDAMDSPDWWWDTDTAVPGDPSYATWDSFFWANRPDLRSVEYRAGCGGGNIGASMGKAQEALIDNGRTEGAVWLMVLLSDGASGISDPIKRDDATDLIEPDVYNQPAAYWAPLPGVYGAFGVCPYGSSSDRGELLTDAANVFPYCSDIEPETRTFCSDKPLPPADLRLSDPACTPGGVQYNESPYDSDDYAHDWADWIAVADLNYDSARSSVQRQSNEQLPTIFTIGIGLEYNPVDSATGVRQCADADWACRRGLVWNYEDYLGEQLLRYIADAGDNNRIDDDYWQCQLGVRVFQSVIPESPPPADLAAYIASNCPEKTDADWGVRGPCEVPSSNPNDRGIWRPLDPLESCGNYFAAGTATELEQVFGVIASRMFTRLSQ